MSHGQPDYNFWLSVQVFGCPYLEQGFGIIILLLVYTYVITRRQKLENSEGVVMKNFWARNGIALPPENSLCLAHLFMPMDSFVTFLDFSFLFFIFLPYFSSSLEFIKYTRTNLLQIQWLSVGQLYQYFWLSGDCFGCPGRTDNQNFERC